MKELLSSVPVSRKDKESFEETVHAQIVEKWDEKSQSNLFVGIQLEKFDDFLVSFKESTGVDGPTMASLKTMVYTDKVEKQIKEFQCEGTDMGGMYGMFAVVKRPEENKVDVAHAIY